MKGRVRESCVLTIERGTEKEKERSMKIHRNTTVEKLREPDLSDTSEELLLDQEDLEEELNEEELEDLKDLNLDLKNRPEEWTVIEDPVKMYLKEIGNPSFNHRGGNQHCQNAYVSGSCPKGLCNKAYGRVQSQIGGKHCQTIHGAGDASFGPDSGGKSGTFAGGGKI